MRATSNACFPPARQSPLSSGLDVTGGVGETFPRTMPRLQPARKAEPFFELTATGDDFERALRNAVRANKESMNDLHETIGRCMKSLRADGMECEAALLTMKAFIRELGIKNRRIASGDVLHTDIMMDQIVRWCIADYYVER